MSDHKQHISYTAADIQRYVQGKLSPAEMHAMEKAALEDPFLADAIEGMQTALETHSETAVNTPLQQAREQIQQRIQSGTTVDAAAPAKVVSVAWWKAAVAAAIIVIGGVWIFNLTNTHEKPALTVAQTTEKAKEPEQRSEVDALADTDSAVAAVTPPTSSKPEAFKAKKPAASTESSASAPAVAESENAEADSISARQALTEAKKEAIDNAVLARRANANNQAAPQASTSKPTNDFNNRNTELITITKDDSQGKLPVTTSKALTGFVKGVVTDPFKNPIANASVYYPGNNNRYDIVTDKSGYFKIATTDSVLDVAVNVVGYGTQNFRLQNNVSLNELQLQPANAKLEEVVVTGLGKKTSGKYRANSPKVIVHDAEPVYGWIAYEQYLEKNKIRPAGYENTTGMVAVSFSVNKKGELSDFKIEKSLTKQLDDEAIRLIAQGPAWKLLKGRKARTTVIVKF